MSNNYSVFKDLNFTAGDSPAIVQMPYRISTTITLMNMGNAEFVGQASIDGGVTYGDEMIIPAGASFEFEMISPTHVKFTHNGTDTSYQLLVIGYD